MSLIPFSCYNLVDRSFPRQTGASSSGEAVAQGSRVSQVGAIRTIPLFLFLLLLMCEELGIMGMGGGIRFLPIHVAVKASFATASGSGFLLI